MNPPGSEGPPATQMAPRNARELLDRGRAFLARQGLDESRLEAELLVAHALGLERLRLFMDLDRPVTEREVALARELLVRRSQREPVAYLTGQREFYGRRFEVGPGVLVPRPETELLVDRVRAFAKGRVFAAGGPAVLDIGTGSGCLAVTLACELPGATVVAIDVSDAALAVAARNGTAHGAAVEWRKEDALERLAAPGGVAAWEPGGPFDVVVSNPPYIAREMRAELPRDVAEHEPEIALFAPRGAPDIWAQRLVIGVGPRLGAGGLLLVELGFDQAPRLRVWLAEKGFDASGKSPRGFTVRFGKDLAGIERYLAIAAPE